MAAFTALSRAQVDDIALAFSLGAVESVTSIAAGTVNSNFRVATDSSQFFMRVNEGKHVEDVEYEGELLAYLHERGVLTPLPLLAKGHPFLEHEGLLISVFPWVRGQTPCRRNLEPTILEQLGRALGQLHLAGRDFPRTKESDYSFPKMESRLEALRSKMANAGLHAEHAYLVASLAELRAEGYTARSLPLGVIHADLFADNVLVGDGAIRALIDFEQASQGRWIYDLAVCLLAWCYGDDFQWDRARHFVRAYQELRPLEADEVSWIYYELLFAATRFALTRLDDVYFDTSLGPDMKAKKDYRRYIDRHRNLSALGAKQIVEQLGLVREC